MTTQKILSFILAGYQLVLKQLLIIKVRTFYLIFLDNLNFSIEPIISSYSLSRNIPRLFDLIEESLKAPNFNDLIRLKNAISSASSTGISSIADSGHSYAMTYASAFLAPSLVWNCYFILFF